MLSSGTEVVVLAVLFVITQHDVSSAKTTEIRNNLTEDVTRLYQETKEKTSNETKLALNTFDDKLKFINMYVSEMANGSDSPYKWFDRAVELYYQFYTVSAKEAEKNNVNLTECALPLSLEILGNLSQTHRKRIDSCLESYTNVSTNVLKEAKKSIVSLSNYTQFFDDHLKKCLNTTLNPTNKSCLKNIKSIMEGWLQVVPGKVANFVRKINFQLGTLKAENDICTASVIIDLGADMDPTLTKDNDCVMTTLKSSGTSMESTVESSAKATTTENSDLHNKNQSNVEVIL